MYVIAVQKARQFTFTPKSSYSTVCGAIYVQYAVQYR
jgi:hypothetical protein